MLSTQIVTLAVAMLASLAIANPIAEVKKARSVAQPDEGRCPPGSFELSPSTVRVTCCESGDTGACEATFNFGVE